MYLTLRKDRGMSRLTQAPLGLIHLGQGQREAIARPISADEMTSSNDGRKSVTKWEKLLSS